MPKAQKSARVPEFITRPYCRRRLLNLIQAAAVDTAFQSSARPMVGCPQYGRAWSIPICAKVRGSAWNDGDLLPQTGVSRRTQTPIAELATPGGHDD